MTENKGDLISREVLKAEIINNFDNLQAYFPKDFIEEIDNAPTVDLKDIHQEGHLEGYTKAINEERPTGEWIYGEDDCGQDGWFCSECGFFVPWYYQYYEKDINFIRDYKACPHCLAEMITYTGKDRDTKGGEEE